jgi:hypothetical protein
MVLNARGESENRRNKKVPVPFFVAKLVKNRTYSLISSADRFYYKGALAVSRPELTHTINIANTLSEKYGQNANMKDNELFLWVEV